MKACSRCGRSKVEAAFYRRSSSKDGLTPTCKACNTETQRAYRRGRRDQYNAYQRKYLYGLTQEQYDALQVAQNGRCDSCGDPCNRMHVDHDKRCCPGTRSCGACVRSLLCGHCNRGLGYFRDDPKRLIAAAAYVERHLIRVQD